MQIIKNKKIIILSIVFLFFVGCFLLIDVVQAQSFGNASGYLTNIAGRVDLGKREPANVIGIIINGVLGFLGVIAMGYIIYAGIRLMIAGGNDETVQEARDTIKWAIIGLIVIIGAYALSSYVVQKVLKSATEPPLGPEMPIENTEDDLLFGYDCPTFNCTAYNGTDQALCLGPKDDNGQSCCRWHEISSPEFPLEEYPGECRNR